ncbi:hypothetical protein IIA28_13865 [candidate division KSB1 bacterium]|nr:hypothetical protein [candidate division KSB1 bacterium]
MNFAVIHGHDVEALIKKYAAGTLKDSKEGWLNGYDRVLKNIKQPTKEFLEDYKVLLSSLLNEFKLYSVSTSDSNRKTSYYSDSVTAITCLSNSNKFQTSLKAQNEGKSEIVSEGVINNESVRNACPVGIPKGSLKRKIVHRQVQELAKRFQKTLITEGFVEPDYFEKNRDKWWHNNYNYATEMINEEVKRTSDGSRVDVLIRIWEDAIKYYHKYELDNRSDNAFEFVPRVRNLRAIVNFSSLVQEKRKGSKWERRKEELKRKLESY